MILTLLRIALIPVLVLFFYLPYGWAPLASAGVFILAAVTDWLDGYLARKMNQSTPFGAFLDPVADKLLVTTALVLLVEDDRAPALLAAIIIGREIVISALREWLAQVSSIVHVSQLGKWKTAAQMAAIVCLLLNIPLFGISMHLVGLVLLWIASLLTLWSAYEYLRDAWGELIDGNTPEPAGENAPVEKNTSTSEPIDGESNKSGQP
ncbi:MAG: CDP-diacylglycerol--glycerol-3-phosphate 3-phosphatidyltransferase [Mariprofundaceae bacterium]|nr:CDP-diacylglycerol--glycerol-3-phosphate 3-phosphatidyltransferase [Mariprofundaceae bacterium]